MVDDKYTFVADDFGDDNDDYVGVDKFTYGDVSFLVGDYD